jgi:hypothetical protein
MEKCNRNDKLLQISYFHIALNMKSISNWTELTICKAFHLPVIYFMKKKGTMDLSFFLSILILKAFYNNYFDYFQ